MSKKRVDELLVEKNLAEDIDKARRLVMAGLVYSKQVRIDKPGMKMDESTPFSVKRNENPYVGRGGLKLEKALNYFSIDAKDKILIDIGSSTGGFTDCALQHGAHLSYAIDVGYNQLAWKLRNDDRVIVMERTNFRHVTPEMLKKGKPNLATIDVSFISLRLILPVLKQLLEGNSVVIALIKPQFEAKKENVGDKGIVRDKEIHASVVNEMIQFAEKEGYKFHDLTYSPITGSEGNIEFLAYFSWGRLSENNAHFSVEKIVDDAHAHFFNNQNN